MMDLDEKIARLVCPLPENGADGGPWVGDADFDLAWRVHPSPGPMPFSRSVDASLAVIEKRWANGCVTLNVKNHKAHITPDVERCFWKSLPWFDGESTAEALALALLAALESEPKP